MNVPKCLECKYHKLAKAVWTDKKERHWCTNFKVLLFKTDDKYISAKESQTSPKWCPLRVDTNQ